MSFYALTLLQFIILNMSLILAVKRSNVYHVPLPLYQSSWAHLSSRNVNNYLEEQVNWLNFSLARLHNMSYCWQDWKLIYDPGNSFLCAENEPYLKYFQSYLKNFNSYLKNLYSYLKTFIHIWKTFIQIWKPLFIFQKLLFCSNVY